MRKFFSFGKKESRDSAASDSKSRKSAKLETLKEEMNTYKGQKYNPAEDDSITTESIFKVVDGDTGEMIDVRELLGITEEEFKANPELLNAITHMNKI